MRFRIVIFFYVILYKTFQSYFIYLLPQLLPDVPQFPVYGISCSFSLLFYHLPYSSPPPNFSLSKNNKTLPPGLRHLCKRGDRKIVRDRVNKWLWGNGVLHTQRDWYTHQLRDSGTMPNSSQASLVLKGWKNITRRLCKSWTTVPAHEGQLC